MQLSRRQCLLWAASFASTAGLGACANAVTSPKVRSGAGFFEQQVGHARITALSDGVGRRPLDAHFVKNAALHEVQAVLAAAKLPIAHIDVPYTCYVVELDGKRYLLDAGFSDNGAAGSGHLQQNMRAAGIDPSSINAIIISHMHGDHIQGLRYKDGRLTYPNAKVYIPKPEADFWFNENHLLTAPETARAGFRVVQRVFKNYPTQQLQLFTPGEDIAPGIQTIAAFGHSPGHTAIRVHSAGQAFTFIADAAHLPLLFVEHPDWQVMFDMHPEQARATRHVLLGRLADQGDWVGGYHFPLPGMGKMQRTAKGYHWKPR